MQKELKTAMVGELVELLREIVNGPIGRVWYTGGNTCAWCAVLTTEHMRSVDVFAHRDSCVWFRASKLIERYDA